VVGQIEEAFLKPGPSVPQIDLTGVIGGP